MIQNKIYRVNAVDAKKIVQETRSETILHLVELDGKEIQSWDDYYKEVEMGFQFPTISINYDAYHDWITDLDWIGKEGYVLIIYDYNSFLEQDSSLKKLIMEDFADSILPWWQGDVESSVVNCVVGGKAKPFNVYLVD